MPGPVETIVLLVTWVTGLALLMRRELGTAPPGTEDAPRLRGWTVAALALPFTAPLTFGIALALADRPLPVRPPGPESGCSGSSSGGDGTIILVAILILIAVRLGPCLIAYLVARRPVRAARGVPSARLTLRVAAAGFGALAGVAVVRLLLGGVADTAFTTYGAVTPEDASGWRVEATLRRHRTDGRRRVLDRAPAIDSDVRETHGHLRLVPGPHEVDGLKARIAGQPVNLVAGQGGTLAVQDVRRSGVDPARRPRWSAAPWWTDGTGGTGSRLIVGPAEGGGLLAVRVNVLPPGVHLVGARRSDVGLLLGPPVIPLLLALLIAAGAVVLGVGARRLANDGTPRAAARAALRRAGAAALLLEAALVVLGAYRIYL